MRSLGPLTLNIFDLTSGETAEAMRTQKLTEVHRLGRVVWETYDAFAQGLPLPAHRSTTPPIPGWDTGPKIAERFDQLSPEERMAGSVVEFAFYESDTWLQVPLAQIFEQGWWDIGALEDHMAQVPDDPLDPMQGDLEPTLVCRCDAPYTRRERRKENEPWCTYMPPSDLWKYDSTFVLASDGEDEEQIATFVEAGCPPEKRPRAGRKAISDETKIFVWRRDAGRCVNCGSNENLEFDHIIPLTMGGSNTSRNLQLLCEGCNRSKGGDLA